MPRKARIDAPGALHHIICRGIERRKIFDDNSGRDKFLDRLENTLKETSTPCYAWALIPNHFHLLLRTGKTSISMVMRRVLTGYAVSYNRRHQPRRVKARSLVCYWAVRELGMSGTKVSKLMGIGQPAVSRSVVRGEKLAQDMDLRLIA